MAAVRQAVDIEAVVPGAPQDVVVEIGEAAVQAAQKVDAGCDKPDPQSWPLWKLCLLALPQLGVQVMWCFLGPSSAPYMIHLGMGPSLATLNNIAGPVVGFFTGPLVGAWSDRCTSRFGRRRPVILAGLVSTWVAGLIFSSSEHIIPGQGKVIFAAAMYWVLDVTVNVLQTPNRALVADLASEEQQVPMQVVFVFFMALGNFIGFSIMQIFKNPIDHMLELMLLICGVNTLCVGIQFLVAKEMPLTRSEHSSASACAPVVSVLQSVRGMPCLLYQLAGVQCLVWIGNTAWNNYGAQWFANSVYGGSQHADKNTPAGKAAQEAYDAGIAAFSQGGQYRSVLQLLAALVIIAILLKTSLRPRLLYAPCIFIGAVVDFLAAFAVGTSGAFAITCQTISIMPEAGSFAIPFGLVAILNKRAEEEGKQVSTALQMALLNCCVTIGQQLCTLSLAAMEATLPLSKALPLAFVMAGVARLIGGIGTLFLNDNPGEARGTKSDVPSS